MPIFLEDECLRAGGPNCRASCEGLVADGVIVAEVRSNSKRSQRFRLVLFVITNTGNHVNLYLIVDTPPQVL